MSNGRRTLLNRIVREDIAGGALALDLATLVQQMRLRAQPASEAAAVLETIKMRLNEITQAMRDQADAWDKEDQGKSA